MTKEFDKTEKFDRKFPSLSKVGVHNIDIVGVTTLVKRTSHYSEEEIMEHCIDKQRISKAIDDGFRNDCEWKDYLREELGLDK